MNKLALSLGLLIGGAALAGGAGAPPPPRPVAPVTTPAPITVPAPVITQPVTQPTTAQPTTTVTTVTTTQPVCVPLATALQNAQLSTLRGLVNDAGLTQTLLGGQFTIFAPVNSAFAAIPAADLAAVRNDPETLRSVLTYHVLPLIVTASDLESIGSFETVQGQTVVAEGMAADLTIGGARVLGTVNTCTATVYLIDRVLMPDMDMGMGMETTATMETTTTMETTVTETTAVNSDLFVDVDFDAEVERSLISVLESDGRFTILLQAIEAANLKVAFSRPGAYTLLAPTDEAFRRLPAADLQAVLADPALLFDVLSNHVLIGRQGAVEIRGSANVENLLGGNLTVLMGTNDTVRIGAATVIDVDLEADNGIVHVIDTVLLPPAP